MRRLLLPLLFSVATCALASACGDACRTAEVRELSLSCGRQALEGEIHFDSAAAFETFLTDQCMPDADAADIAAIVDDVDFATDAVWVGVRRNAIDESRCIATRELDVAQVCSSGLKVSFVDVLENDTSDGCTGRWTVAFVIARDDLLAALDGAEGQ